ncbi:hypothetical protein EV356DRAFT_501601 [Viridothelium virens]|uniref:Methyltransferase domain-containing protein n=1 Tax=Viridothelium virens TaxID=1048519 RepID=A0A6A6H9A7_VIRVR|nr:hypothetical protein EV356DRAFT_501601 [Viridothelium virens]
MSVTTAKSHQHAKESYSFDTSKWWYELEEIPKPTREVFENYSNIAAEKVLPHVEELRIRAFKVFPYPCIGENRFLNLTLSRHFLYPKVLSILRQNSLQHAPKLLDVGCCLAQDLRKIVYDGVPSENVYGLDRDSRFIELSFDLFLDKESLRSRFVAADLMAGSTENADDDRKDETQNGANEQDTRNPSYYAAPSGTFSSRFVPMESLYGQMSVVVVNSFFHLYNYDEQKELAKRVVRFLRPQSGSLILGRQVGSSQPGHFDSISDKNSGAKRYAHNIKSLRDFWNEVADEIGGGCKFRLEATMDFEELGRNLSQGQSWAEPNIARLLFGVWWE